MDKKFIDIDVLAERIYNKINNPAVRSWILAIINEIPAADVQEVRHGEWMYNDLYFPSCAECSECGWKSSVGGEEIPSYHYCPRCGARMDGG